MSSVMMERDLELEVNADFQESDSEEGFNDTTDEYYQQFMWDASAYAKMCIDKFFEGKEMYCGGDIPKRLLNDAQYIALVANTDVMDGVDLAYTALRRSHHRVTIPSTEITTVPNDVKFVISILNHCKSLAIPKVFSTGLMLMYLEICEGVNIISGP